MNEKMKQTTAPDAVRGMKIVGHISFGDAAVVWNDKPEPGTWLYAVATPAVVSKSMAKRIAHQRGDAPAVDGGECARSSVKETLAAIRGTDEYKAERAKLEGELATPPADAEQRAIDWFTEYDKQNHFPEKLAADAWNAGYAAALRERPAQVEAPWRSFDVAMGAKALATAQEIALMWGQDREQFVSRIQAAVREAMDWIAAGTTPPPAVDVGGRHEG